MIEATVVVIVVVSTVVEGATDVGTVGLKWFAQFLLILQ